MDPTMGFVTGGRDSFVPWPTAAARLLIEDKRKVREIVQFAM
jgi:hypothetical protein